MVRFSCFHSNPSSSKSKGVPFKSKSLSSLFKKEQPCDNIKNLSSSASADRSCKSEEFNGELEVFCDRNLQKLAPLRKSHSMGSGLCDDIQVSSSYDEIDHECSPEPFDSGLFDGPIDTNETAVTRTNTEDRSQSSDVKNNKSIFTIGAPLHSEKGSPEDSDTGCSGEVANESCYKLPRIAAEMITSPSLPEIGIAAYCSDGYMSGSLEDLYALERVGNDVSILESLTQSPNEEPNARFCSPDVDIDMDYFTDGCINSESPKDLEVTGAGEATSTDYVFEKSLNEEVTNENFKFMRITDWVNDLQQFDTEETMRELLDELPQNLSNSQDDELLSYKVDDKVSSIEAVKSYISTLSPSATTAQLSNLGLNVIPFMSPFSAMKALNLSGNAIAKITPGTLPRGLHYLNLSRNKISVIEGLRELTRLRVLNLSCNRILRIGHGLGSCSSIKELYLAGNKISEIDGLHRLLKLTVLDLRLNKISTPKSLGQLAANYNSLHVIGLEGNPVQKNVGEEQLKRYLIGLLPQLVFFNRQATKSNALKDASDRLVKRGLVPHQFDRGLRSDNKHQRKGTRATSSSRATSSLVHAQKIRVPSPKGSFPRASHRSLLGNEASSRHHHRPRDAGHLNTMSGLAIRRSQSEGALTAV